MPIPRIAFEQLPADARRAVADKTGTVHHTETMTGGMNSGIASVLHTGSGPVFVKGIPADHHQVDAQRREAAVAPLLPASCPRLHWHIEAAGWSLLGYEVVHGRHADYAPGSADLPLVEAALTELQAVTAPADLDIKEAADRWKNYALPDVLHYFRGTALLHTDFAPDNILITGGRARLVDWAWPTRGAAWLDPGALALRLMEAGHSVEDALRFADRFPSWHDAEARALAAFSMASAALWREISEQSPAEWKQELARHAALLADYLAEDR